jgi:hypothetical protein
MASLACLRSKAAVNRTQSRRFAYAGQRRIGLLRMGEALFPSPDPASSGTRRRFFHSAKKHHQPQCAIHAHMGPYYKAAGAFCTSL